MCANALLASCRSHSSATFAVYLSLSRTLLRPRMALTENKLELLTQQVIFDHRIVTYRVAARIFKISAWDAKKSVLPSELLELSSLSTVMPAFCASFTSRATAKPMRLM